MSRPRGDGSSVLVSLAWFLLAYALSAFAYLALNGLASRLLGPSSFGWFVVLTTTAVLMSQVGLLGSHRAVLRDAARAADSTLEYRVGIREEARCIYSTALPIVGLLTGASTTVAALFGSSGLDAVVLGITTASLVMVSGGQKLAAALLRGFGVVRSAAFLEGATGGAWILGMQASALGALWLLVDHMTLQVTLVVLSLAHVVPLVWAYRRLRTIWGATTAAPSARLLPAIARRNWGFTSAQVAAFLAVNLEIWIGAAFLVGPELSTFGAAQRLALTLAAPLFALQVVMSPVLARLVHSEPVRLVEQMTKAAGGLALLGGLVVTLPVMVAPGLILAVVYGPGYAAGSWVLVAFAVGAMANLATGLCTPLLAMSGNEHVVARAHWSSVGVRLVLCPPAAALIGAVGLAVVGTVVATLTWLWLMVEAWRRLHVSTLPSLRPDLRLLRRTLA